MNLLISDLDNTLGKNEKEIGEGIKLVLKYHNICDICFITGRSLTSLLPFEELFIANTYLSPWGGGNLLKKISIRKYAIVDDFERYTDFNIFSDLTYLFIPDTRIISFEDEIKLMNFDSLTDNNLQCVGAYRQVNNSAKLNSLNKGLDGLFFQIFTAFDNPRLNLIKKLSLKKSYSKIIYIGDDYCDINCIDFVDHFIAPIESIASKNTKSIKFVTHENLENILNLLIT
jgi:hypothetical protein